MFLQASSLVVFEITLSKLLFIQFLSYTTLPAWCVTDLLFTLVLSLIFTRVCSVVAFLAT